MSEHNQAAKPMSDRDWLIEASDEIDSVERIGYESDIEATRYIMLSDKLARVLTRRMRAIAKNIERQNEAVSLAYVVVGSDGGTPHQQGARRGMNNG